MVRHISQALIEVLEERARLAPDIHSAKRFLKLAEQIRSKGKDEDTSSSTLESIQLELELPD